MDFNYDDLPDEWKKAEVNVLTNTTEEYSAEKKLADEKTLVFTQKDKIYEFVEGLYCEDNGRPSIDPVILFKMVLIQHLYGITSLRRVAKEVSMNVAYRWF